MPLIDRAGFEAHEELLPTTTPAEKEAAVTLLETRETRRGLHISLIAGMTLVLLCVVVLAPPIILGALSRRIQDHLSSTACVPNGDFALPGSINVWNIDYILTITLGFGELTFTNAKLIDVFWDVGVGRGGQLLLAWIAYRVFSKVIVYIMEEDDVTYDSYAAIAFGSGSVRSTWTLFADFMCAQIPKTWSACLFYLAMIWTSVYIIVFPTLASAMTSYGPISTALILTDMSSWDVWEPLWASISNGDDIGLPKGYAVRSLTAQGFNKTDERIHAYYDNYKDKYEAYEEALYTEGRYGSPSDSGYILCGEPSDSPTLTALNVDSAINIDNKTYNMPYTLLDIKVYGGPNPDRAHAWYHNGMTLLEKDLPFEGQCQPSKQYQWGFSFLLLFIMSMLNVGFACTMYLLWLVAHRHSRADRSPRYKPHIWRAVMDMSKQARASAGVNAEDWDTDRLAKGLKGKKMTIKDENLPASRSEERRSLWQRKLYGPIG